MLFHDLKKITDGLLFWSCFCALFQGNPGTTYKYLGLRMFSHPWTAGDETCAEPVAAALTQVCLACNV